MTGPMSESGITALTRAEKRKITIAAKAEKARQEQVGFEAESRATGGRQAKKEANQKAVWNVDQTATRKRTSSTTPVSDKPKKARETQPANESGAEDVEPKAPSKAKASTAFDLARNPSFWFSKYLLRSDFESWPI
ncbi:hypothetical protein B0H13DRAFT_2300090 [Mycena leptocephala]|nr:hypothetical protein B0H13DRAFT_2300090 [Mycena leptocephala]